MIKTIAATALSAVMAITSVAQVQAFPMPLVSRSSQVEKVEWKSEIEKSGSCPGINNYPESGGHCHFRPDRGRERYDRDWYRSDADNNRYWHGHRGYRDYRPGYRRSDDGWWYPLAAFGLGAAIIGGMAAQQAPRPRVGVAMPVNHVRWCQARYRSYDPYSDTFQPNRGPRQRCISPY